MPAPRIAVNILEPQTFVTVSGPFMLAPGHPWRQAHCLLCGLMIGGSECVTVLIAYQSEVIIDLPDLPASLWAICAHHDLSDGNQMVERAEHMFTIAYPPPEGDY
jgi:hypothetical protein